MITVDHAQIRSGRGRVGLLEASRRVVVGQCQQADIALQGQRDQLRWCERAIGKMAVGVQVDESFHPAGIIRR